MGKTKELKHTPGPWWIWKERAGCDEGHLLGDTEHDIHAGTPDTCTPSVLSGHDYVGVCRVSDMEDANEGDATRLANARLIAAAPELLDALQTVLFSARDGAVLPRDAAHQQARTAIAKAEGRA